MGTKSMQDNRRVTAGVLALLLGGFGVHKFYQGKWLWGVIYLALCFTFVPMVVGFVEGIHYLSISDEQYITRVERHRVVDASQAFPTPETHVKCPDCRELVLKDARKCKHCHAPLIPQP